jgi:hypothetical protein
VLEIFSRRRLTKPLVILTGIADEIVISGKTSDEHNKNLTAVVEHAQEKSVNIALGV